MKSSSLALVLAKAGGTLISSMEQCSMAQWNEQNPDSRDPANARFAWQVYIKLF